MASKTKGLVLSLGNAPDTPHWVVDAATGAPLPGLYRKSQATPVGGPGDPLTLEQAREQDRDPGSPLKLVDIPERDVERLREEHAAAVAESRSAAVLFRRDDRPDGAEPQQVRDELAATSLT